MSGRNSVFLIDDLGAEMDQKHSAALFRLLGEMGSQILATSNHLPGESRSTNLSDSMVPVTMFHVEHGKIEARPSGAEPTFPEAT